MPEVAVHNSQVIDNLQAAFAAEANTHARYTAFAAQAAAEGWRGIASLFRAAARAEQIHAGNHGRILHQLGGETDYARMPTEPATTLQNLKESLARERYEAGVIYPAFIEQARAGKDAAATRSFTWAWEAEKTHVRLLSGAVALVEICERNSWAASTRAFYVCPVCGYTSERPDERDSCMVCHCSWKRFEVNR